MNNDEVKLWKDKIIRAESYQTRQHPMWKDAIDLYNCDYFNKTMGGFDFERVDVHFINWYVNNLVPLVYFRDPFIFVKGKSDKYIDFAETLEKLINIQWKKLRLKQQFKKVIMSSLLMPPGWIKLGYTAKIGEDVAEHEENKEKGIIQGIKDAVLGVFKDKNDDGYEEEKGILNQYIKEESCFATWIPSWKILVPEGYALVTDMPYLIEMEDVTLLDFSNNPMYKNKKDVKGTREIKDNSSGIALNKVPFTGITPGDINDMNILRLYHVWDRRSHKRFTVSMQSDDSHFEGDWPYDMEGFPFKPMVFEESLPTLDESNFYPPNLIKPILPQVIEQSMSRTQMVKYRKRASAIILAQRGLATEEDIGQLEDSEAIQICVVSNLSAFQMTQTPPLPQEVFSVDEVIKQDLQSATNMGQMMFQAQKGTRTATQAQIGQSGLQLKASARVDVVEDFTVEVAMSIAQLDWQFYDREKVSAEIGEEVTESMWPDLPSDVRERCKIIQSEIQFRIDAGSTAPPKDETVDRKQLLDYASVINSIAPERLNKGEFAKQLTKKFKFTKEVDKIVMTNDDDERACADKENELLAKGIPCIVSPNNNHMIHIQEHVKIGQHTPQSDQHIQDHGAAMGIKPGVGGGGGGPQKGDVRPPMKSTNPEMVRQGIPNQGDVYQSVQNIGAGSGPEAR